MADLVKNNLGLEVLTDTGWSNFDGVLNKGLRQIATLQLTRDTIKATLDHKIYTAGLSTLQIKQLSVGTLIHTCLLYTSDAADE